jgi:hypothetical protein
MAISTTLFLFIHTRELHTKLKAMEVKLQPEEMISGKGHTFAAFRQSPESLSDYVVGQTIYEPQQTVCAP